MRMKLVLRLCLLAGLPLLAAPPAAAEGCGPAPRTPAARAGMTAVFMDDESSPAMGRYLWAYTVRVENTGAGPLTLVARCLEVAAEPHPVAVDAGQGLVGQTPRLGSGAAHEYTSWVPLPVASGSIRGHIVARDDAGRLLRIPLAPVQLQMPDTPGSLTDTGKAPAAVKSPGRAL